MGKKKEPVEVKEEPKVEVTADAEEEDTPVIKQLKAIDDKYCAAEVELEKEIEKLRVKYTARQTPLLAERRVVLNDASNAESDAKELGTPGCPDFWLTALSNANELEEVLQECDSAVLRYLDDIQRSYPVPETPQKALRLEFTFKENPFFTNTVLFAEATFDYDPETYKPYKECQCIEVKSSVIDWKAGKNVTVEKRKDAGGKKGKKKPAKTVEEPVPSFFRIVFNSLKADEPLPEGLACVYQDGEDDDEEDMSEMHLLNMSELLSFMSDQLLPYAVRYYTGEACEEDDDDDEEEEEEDDDDDESSDEESEEVAKPKKGGKKPVPKKGSGDAAGEKAEECKQQ